eukprot:COSAG01_NODE_25050_length_757_cov_1.053191_1_plen_252_part_11
MHGVGFRVLGFRVAGQHDSMVSHGRYSHQSSPTYSESSSFSARGQSMSAFYSAASASEPPYRFTRGSLAQSYRQAAERRRKEEWRIQEELRRKAAAEKRRREAEAAERARRERAITAELGMWQFYAAGGGIEPPLRLGYEAPFVAGDVLRSMVMADTSMVAFYEGSARSEVQVSAVRHSAASASEPQLWAAYRFTRRSLAQSYEQAAERRREEERRIEEALQRKAAAEQRRREAREAEAAERARRERALTAE